MPEIFCRQGNKCVYYHTKESSMIDQKNIDELKIKVEFLNKLFKQCNAMVNKIFHLQNYLHEQNCGGETGSESHNNAETNSKDKNKILN